MILLSLFFLLISARSVVPSSSIQNLCLTPGCVKAAAEILHNLDETVDPCEDFYKFSCGGWINRHTIPEYESSVSAFSKVEDNLNLKLKVLLDQEVNESEPPFTKMVKEMYGTCMDLKSIEKSGSEPLREVLKALGGWPVVEGSDWDDSNFNWVKSLIALRKLGFNQDILLDLSVTIDYRNNSVHIIDLDQTHLGMPDREYFIRGLNDSGTAAYYKMMIESAKLLGADENTAEKELLKALHFETALANYSLPREERRNFSRLYNKYTVEGLQEMVPQIPWLEYFNGLLNDRVFKNDTVIVSVPEFVKNFAKLITNTEKRVVANYMLWRVVAQSLPFLSKEWRGIAHQYKSVLTGKTEEEPRWKKCLSFLEGGLGIALGSYYVKHHFKQDSKDAALELVNYVHKQFLDILENLDWMDDVTKKHAKDKAHAIETFIGYPKELLNDTAVMEHYKNLTITGDSYFENIKNLRKFWTDYAFSKLRKPNIRREWKKHAEAAVVNAFYDVLDNSIEFPAGILQGNVYSKDRPNYLNFGAIGSVIGHEITHGFDDQGRQFDTDGNNVNWWAEETDEHFKKKAQCIIDQYGNYTADNGMKLNGINTQGENIADNGGLKEAYWAYHSWVKVNGPEKLLPGLNYSQGQMFWIGTANVWCGKYRPEILKLRILAGSHSPSRFRVIGPMSNLAEFSKDFGCPPDSSMNKKHKCQVW